MSKKRKAPDVVIRRLKEIHRIISLGAPGNTCAVDQKAKDAMQPYLDTWAAYPLTEVLKYLEGEWDARDLEHWRY